MNRKRNMFPIVNKTQMATNTSVELSRLGLAAYLGQSFGGDRDLYESCGYPINLYYKDFFARYIRQDIAKRIVNAYPDSTWRLIPEIYDNADSKVETEFERVWKSVARSKKIYYYLRRADVLSQIGQYSILLLGFADGKDPKIPIVEGKGNRLLYTRPYSQENASILEWDDDKNSERYGMPKVYDLTINNPNNIIGSGNSKNYDHLYVHYTRIVHIAEGLLEDDTYGTPRLECVYNRLQDVETILGGSTEMHWQFGFPGMAFEADSDAQWDPQTKSDLQSEISEYIHGLKRFMRLRGIKVNQLLPSGTDPTALLTTQLKHISGATGIPIRVLVGSERGELASTQDDKNWNSRVAERRMMIGEEVILRPLVDKLIYAGVLPIPIDINYSIDWPDIDAPSDNDKADISLKRMQALQLYMNAIGAQDVYPPEKFLENEMSLSAEEVKAIMEDYRKSVINEELLAQQDELLLGQQQK